MIWGPRARELSEARPQIPALCGTLTWVHLSHLKRTWVHRKLPRWRIPGTSTYVKVKEGEEGEVVPGVLVVRPGASLFFANVFYLENVLRAHLANLEATETLK